MATRTTNLGFFRLTDNAKNWHHYFNANVDIFNTVALKLQSLGDVDVVSLVDGAIIKYDASTSKWKVVVN